MSYVCFSDDVSSLMDKIKCAQDLEAIAVSLSFL